MNEVSSDKHGISRNVLKIIAIVTITIGHFFLYTFSTTRCFGVGKPWVGFMMMVCFIGPPIFMFFISEGFIHTSSRKRYGTRLLIFALITQIAFSITTTGGWGFSFKTFFFNWNVFFALFLGFIDLCIIESRQKPAVKVIGILATLLLSYFTNTEWWVFGQLIIITHYMLRKHNVIRFIVAFLFFYLTFVFANCNFGSGFYPVIINTGMLYELFYGAIGTALVCFFYHGKNGKKSKILQYFFYVFYPLHLILIDIVNYLGGN